jgi:hypothetical protein
LSISTRRSTDPSYRGCFLFTSPSVQRDWRGAMPPKFIFNKDSLPESFGSIMPNIRPMMPFAASAYPFA